MERQQTSLIATLNAVTSAINQKIESIEQTIASRPGVDPDLSFRAAPSIPSKLWRYSSAALPYGISFERPTRYFIEQHWGEHIARSMVAIPWWTALASGNRFSNASEWIRTTHGSDPTYGTGPAHFGQL